MTIAIGLTVLSSNSAAGQAGEADTMPFVRPLVGSTLEQVVEMLGRPFNVIPLRETDGKLLFFENRHGDEYVIETDGTNHVVQAAVKHPENR
ncbi:MAG TPA: hypothetical protein VKB84_19860 [Candidatus Binataceae bacterium]|jgi:hypothetical protein|nr:hypothetical protein [Candidatus Binataceae bacterium]